jgi:hypothetical protein
MLPAAQEGIKDAMSRNPADFNRSKELSYIAEQILEIIVDPANDLSKYDSQFFRFDAEEDALEAAIILKIAIYRDQGDEERIQKLTLVLNYIIDNDLASIPVSKFKADIQRITVLNSPANSLFPTETTRVWSALKRSGVTLIRHFQYIRDVKELEDIRQLGDKHMPDILTALEERNVFIGSLVANTDFIRVDLPIRIALCDSLNLQSPRSLQSLTRDELLVFMNSAENNYVRKGYIQELVDADCPAAKSLYQELFSSES